MLQNSKITFFHMKNGQKDMFFAKLEGQMALLSEGSSVKESPEDTQASAPCFRGSTLMWGPIFSVKSGLVPGFSGRSQYSITPTIQTWPLGQAWMDGGGVPWVTPIH